MVKVGETYKVKKCSHCGAGAKVSDFFCVICGTKFNDAQIHDKQTDESKLVKTTKNTPAEILKNQNSPGRNHVSKYALRGFYDPAPKTKLKPTFTAFLVIIVACFAIWVLFSSGIRTLLR